MVGRGRKPSSKNTYPNSLVMVLHDNEEGDSVRNWILYTRAYVLLMIHLSFQM